MTLDNGYDKEIKRGQRSRFYSEIDHTKINKTKKKERKIKKEKEREVYGDNGCIRCALEGIPLVIIVTSRNESQAATAVSSTYKAYIT